MYFEVCDFPNSTCHRGCNVFIVFFVLPLRVDAVFWVVTALSGETARRASGCVQGRQPQAGNGGDPVRLRGPLRLPTLLRDRLELARLPW